MLPGMKHRMKIWWSTCSGHTIVLPVRFGSVIKASSGTPIQLFSKRTRQWPLFDSQSTSLTAKPSANEQHSPLLDLRLSNQVFNSGWPGSWAKTGATTPKKCDQYSCGSHQGRRNYRQVTGFRSEGAARLAATANHVGALAQTRKA